MLALPEGPAGLSAARAQARRVCDDNHVEPDRCDAVELVLSELLGNACRHGADPVTYRTHLDAADVMVTVADAEPLPPVEHADPDPDPDAEGGRGLFLVNAVSRSWGWEPTPSGKQVWARV
jgi:anti-sigma regulatory factor (Ser/Thr protein kinase)